MDKERPNFHAHKEEMEKIFSFPGQSIMDESGKLSIERLDRFLEEELVNKLPRSDVELIKLWAYATAVSSKPSLEATIAIGKGIQDGFQVQGLLNTS
ncbi:MAG: hypothetical protein WDO15_06235 [Bacteroidota bacterium]